jgi:hypothetical protein
MTTKKKTPVIQKKTPVSKIHKNNKTKVQRDKVSINKKTVVVAPIREVSNGD